MSLLTPPSKPPPFKSPLWFVLASTPFPFPLCRESSVLQWPPTSSTIPPFFPFPSQSLFPSPRSPRWHLFCAT
eukprot:g73891.t1